MWVKGRQNIPKKHLPVLEELFGIDQSYFGRELSEIEQLEIQKEKLKRALNPVITTYEEQFSSGEFNDLVEVPIYDQEEMNAIEREIEEAKLVSKIKTAMDIVDNNLYLETYKLIVELLEKVQHESVLHKTVKALTHYYEVLSN